MGDKMFKCPVCGRECKEFTYLKQHFISKHRVGYCLICNKPYRKLLKHMQMKAKCGCKKHMVLWVLSNNRKHKPPEYKEYKERTIKLLLDGFKF